MDFAHFLDRCFWIGEHQVFGNLKSNTAGYELMALRQAAQAGNEVLLLKLQGRYVDRDADGDALLPPFARLAQGFIENPIADFDNQSLYLR